MEIRLGVKCALTTALAVALLFATSLASANGRFPRGEHLIEYPSNSNRLLLAATYGLVETDDGGKNWYYICESGFSLEPTNGFSGDPVLSLTDDETLLAGADKRITKSSDHGCGWTKAFEDTTKGIRDIAVAPSNRKITVALVQTFATSAMQLYETTDGGLTWNPIGTPLTMLKTAQTVDVDPTDPTHLMVSGNISDTPGVSSGVLLTSSNNGMTWTMYPIPNTPPEAPPYIAGVHPTDPKKIFVRTDAWIDDGSGAYTAQDALLYSKDGGQTWTELIHPQGMDGGAKLYGFALSPDGSQVIVGYGDPVQGGGRNVDRTVMGVYKSAGADYSFGASPTAIYVESATCLTWTKKGIYVCGSPDGMTSYIGFATDINNVTSAGLTKIMQVNKLKGVPPCCSGRAVSACDWSVDCLRFDACLDGGTSQPPDAGVCPEGGTGTGGSGGADAGKDSSTGSGGSGNTGGSGTGGAGNTGGNGGTAGSTGGSGGSGTTSSGGSSGSSGCSICSIATPSRGGSLSAVSLLLGLASALGLRRTRRRSQDVV